jgi:hypothetical protein
MEVYRIKPEEKPPLVAVLPFEMHLRITGYSTIQNEQTSFLVASDIYYNMARQLRAVSPTEADDEADAVWLEEAMRGNRTSLNRVAEQLETRYIVFGKGEGGPPARFVVSLWDSETGKTIHTIRMSMMSFGSNSAEWKSIADQLVDAITANE